MAYKYFDINNQELFNPDLQNKNKWCKAGEKIEESFIRLYGKELGLIINPQKATNPYAPDLLNIINNKLGDLKFQSTPFFKAKSLYNTDPTYAVVFNLKDQLRYVNNYPDVEIYYWVNWIALKFQMWNTEIIVNPLFGVWTVEFPIFNKYLASRPLHDYQQRVNDNKGNAKSSYVCDIRDEIFNKLI